SSLLFLPIESTKTCGFAYSNGVFNDTYHRNKHWEKDNITSFKYATSTAYSPFLHLHDHSL
ncbi:MAG TPA: hypothetical protein VEP90_18660, partial [Methylomirabilota bacterium]|nr:hypothetical protein [Methylomirabilota bacterium]